MQSLSLRRALMMGACIALAGSAGSQAQPVAGPSIEQSPPAGAAIAIVAPPGAPAPDVPPDLPVFPDPPPRADAPKPSSDPRNLEGTWRHDQALIMRMSKDMYGKPLPYTPKGKRIVEGRLKATYETGIPYSNASGECLPPGQPWQLEIPTPLQIYQTPQEIIIVFAEYHGAWTIRLNQRHRVTDVRRYDGDSVGHWDGDTLVVDTVNYKRPLWIDVDGTPASRNARIMHRIRKLNHGAPQLEIVTTVHDPEMFTTPWSFVRTFGWRPDSDIFPEYNCEFQVGSRDGVSRYGIIPEPSDPQ